MRVLHCIPSMEGGGAERQLTYLAAGLHQLGIDTHVALVSRGPNWTRLMATGATVHELPARGAHDPLLFVRLLTKIRAIHPDLVQVWLRQMDILGGIASLAQRKPFILTERASEPAYPPSLKHAMRLRVGGFASAVVANSEEGARYWRGHTRRHGRTCVISNAVPVGEITDTPPETIVTVGRRVVLFAGRMEPQKNIDVLLPALLTALEDIDFDTIFCGEGSLKARIVDWIERQGVGSRARVLGYTTKLWGLMKRASMLVSPALFEGTPNVVLEAMACRCPLVVSDIREHREFLDESAACFARPDSPADLARAIRSVFQDPESARARADVAFARVERFDPAMIAQRYVDLYRSILAEPCTAVRRASI
ncbi:MAG: glycosyltransferase [Vicinamibacterales bacterium]